MNTLPDKLSERLLYILHRGLVQIRNMALQDNEQIADLADALEILPQSVLNCTQDRFEMAQFVLKNYQSKYPETAHNLLGYLEEYDVPERY